MKNDACKLADHEERRGAGSLCPRSLAQLTDIPFFFSMDEETSDATIQSESPGPRAPADRGPILNSARACCLPDCRAADVAVVAFWLVCLAVFLAGLWERTVLPMRSKSRADPIYYTGIVMIAVGTLVLLCYFVVRGAHDQIRGASRVVAEG